MSYLNESVPLCCSGTMQGILISTHHGLGAGLGFLLTGLLITKYRAPFTFALYAVFCGAFLVLFVITQRVSKFNNNIQVIFVQLAKRWHGKQMLFVGV